MVMFMCTFPKSLLVEEKFSGVSEKILENEDQLKDLFAR